MTKERLEEIENGNGIEKELLSFIPNHVGINLCSVDDIIATRQEDGQLVECVIKFIPDNKN